MKQVVLPRHDLDQFTGCTLHGMRSDGQRELHSTAHLYEGFAADFPGL
jgi:hypothetical protein